MPGGVGAGGEKPPATRFCGPYYLGYVPRFLFALLTFAAIEYNFLGFWSTGQTTGN